jgi:hypothetical protein
MESTIIELLELAEFEHTRLIKPTPYPCIATHTTDSRAIDLFEKWQESTPANLVEELKPIEDDPTEFQLNVLKTLPENLRISEIARRFSTSFWFISRALGDLEYIGLVTRRANRRHWPTEKGFALIGVTPIPAPPHPCKAGQSIHFGKGAPTPTKPKAQLPHNVSITESNEGFFININGVTLDVPFDSIELAKRGAEAFLATKLGRKGLADYFQRKRAALFQFMAEA